MDFTVSCPNVWRLFEEICSIPHPSGYEEKLGAWVVQQAKANGLKARRDKIGNIRIDRPAAPGFEKAPLTVMQAHLDMVPQKAPDSNFDFLNDPLKVQITEDRVHCGGETTLGADDGSGVALAMDILTDSALRCGALAALFTREEEIGLNGARELPAEFLEGDFLINLDSGCDDCFYAGCAGGVENYGIFMPEFTNISSGTGVKIEVTGLEGGHSGADIHLKRGNAHKFMAGLLEILGENITHIDNCF